MRNLRSIIMIIIVLILFLFTACTEDDSQRNDIVYIYRAPPTIGDGWETAPMSDVGMDETSMIEFMDELLNHLEHMIHGILIVKEGKLVFEEYFPGYAFYHGAFTEFDRETRHNLASVTKSFTSALVGITLDQGLIQDVDQKVFDFFPEYAGLFTEEKKKITIRHMLTMTSGLQWDESTYPYSDPRNDCAQLFYQDDPIWYILAKPMIAEPGYEFLYNSGITNVLGEIIRRATGLRADDFARGYLFAPLGITDERWQFLSNDICYTSGDLKLRPRDMAKFGQLYLGGGIWKGQQIISEWWIDASTTPNIDAIPPWQYGYQWWLQIHEFNSREIQTFSARGWGGQNIIIFPSLDMVVVTTAGYYDDPELEFHIDGLLMQKIMESVIW